MTHEQKDLLELIRLDYEQTNALVSGIVNTVMAMRGWAITLWSALIGFSIERQSWELSALAIAVLVAFFLIDLYHSELYIHLVSRAREIEELLAKQQAVLGRSHGDSELMFELSASLQSHRLGVWRSLVRQRWRDVIRKAPKLKPLGSFGGAYIFLFAISLIVILSLISRRPEEDGLDKRASPEATPVASVSELSTTRGAVPSTAFATSVHPTRGPDVAQQGVDRESASERERPAMAEGLASPANSAISPAHSDVISTPAVPSSRASVTGTQVPPTPSSNPNDHSDGPAADRGESAPAGKVREGPP